MELLVVVALIVILAGLTIGGMSLVNQNVARKKAGVQVKLLESAIQDYYSDNRKYPVNEDANGQNGSEVLYKALYQDGVDAKTAGTTGAKIYLAELDPNLNKEGKGGQQWIRSSSGGSNVTIVDPWGNAYLYRTGANAQNPDFDLWSAGKDGKTNSSPKHKDSLDDIKNF
ncbi:MAG: bacterial ral secretion pathway protein g signature [Akkermansiaceae bacterium]|nr:bacterial ral secretion pathway protein g signature [Akkermansiaceae bacterium]